MNNLSFQNIISKNSHYGIIWKGLYKGQPCAIKMVILDSGVYDRSKKNPQGYPKDKENYFKSDDEKPFLHTLFRDRKAMTIEKFDHEVEMLKTVGNSYLAARLLDSWKDTSSYPMHYGFIVMEYLECTVKDILHQRDLNSREIKLIHALINKLHSSNFCHGDLKPSNLGVKLNKEGEIVYLRFLDLAKTHPIQHKKEIKRDWKTLQKHIKKNISSRSL